MRVERSIHKVVSYSSVAEMKLELRMRTRKMIDMYSLAVVCNLHDFDRTSIT